MYRKLLFIITICLFVLSCQKELSTENGSGAGNGNSNGTANGTNNSALTGIWNFKYTTVTGKGTSTTQGPGLNSKITSNWGYTTKENSGTLELTKDGKVISKNMGYSIDTTMMMYMYENNFLEDSLEMPFNFPYSSSSSNSTYKLVGSDSIAMGTGFMTMNSGGTTSATATAPGGMKYKISGNELTFVFNVAQDSVINDQGFQLRFTQISNGKFVFTK